MINGKTVLAVIPARGGSKRCPRKNIMDFGGKPLIAWSIEAARGSKYIDHLLLSTDDPEIAATGLLRGLKPGEVLHRPVELASDTASSEAVLRHAMNTKGTDWVVLLQPTSPLRTSADIDACIELAQLGDACVSYRPDGTKNGAVYVARSNWIQLHDFSSPAMRFYMPQERSLDIDHPEDFMPANGPELAWDG